VLSTITSKEVGQIAVFAESKSNKWG